MKKLLSQILVIILLFSSLPLTSLADYDYITLGAYPQTLETDTAVIAKLDAVDKLWRSYGYNTGVNEYGDYMQYADIDLDSDGSFDYRAVCFSLYRPALVYSVATDDASSSYQSINGYSLNTTYYFKYEPLKWRVLDKSTGLVLCENVIDSQSYNKFVNNGYRNVDKTIYSNNWESSDLRRWLNQDFYNTAFSESDIKHIVMTQVDNTGCGRYVDTGIYDYEPSNDNIFLLSYTQVQNGVYGFSESPDMNDSERVAYGTDYAKAQGLGISPETNDSDSPYWTLRSAGHKNSSICMVNDTGLVRDYYGTSDSIFGIRPAFIYSESEVQPSEFEYTCQHRFINTSTDYSHLKSEATCLEPALYYLSCVYCGANGTDCFSSGETVSHNLTKIEATPATCKDKGNIEYYKCTYCHKLYTDENAENQTYQQFISIPKTEEHTWDDGVSLSDDSGGYLYTCTVCGATKTEKPKTSSALGDIDGDGQISETDARIAVRQAIGDTQTLLYDIADINEDGAINLWEARHILRYSVGKEQSIDNQLNIPDALSNFDENSEHKMMLSFNNNEEEDGTFTVSLIFTNMQDLAATFFTIGFNSATVEFVGVSELANALVETYDNKLGNLNVGIVFTDTLGTVDTTIVFTFKFKGNNKVKGFHIMDEKLWTEGNSIQDYTMGVYNCQHTWDDGIVSKEPTCKAQGKKIYTCIQCGSMKEEPIEKLTSHTMGEKVENIIAEATCTEAVLCEYYYICSVCGEHFGKTVEYMTDTMPALGHVDADNDGICERCGEEAIGKIIILGDVNGDGKIRANDARKALRFSAELETPTEFEFTASDVNGDGKIRANDARKILRASAELEDPKTWEALLP